MDKAKKSTEPEPPVTSQAVGLKELLELAISSQDVGTINFNILRLLLEDMINKLNKIDKEPVKLGDHDANQIKNYKNYMQGAPVSPMPGILRTNPAKRIPTQDAQTGPITPRSARPPNLPPAKTETAQKGTSARTGAESPARNKNVSPRGTVLPDHGIIKELQDKIEELEQQMKVITALPENKELFSKLKSDKDGGMSVNDMWQLIQLNNRVAAAEAAIQKMAGLIEDLAKELNKVRGTTVGFGKLMASGIPGQPGTWGGQGQIPGQGSIQQWAGQGVPGQEVSGPPGSGHPGGGQSSSGQGTPGQHGSSQTEGGQIIPGQRAAGQGISGQGAHGQNVQGHGGAGQRESGQSGTGQAWTGQGPPGQDTQGSHGPAGSGQGAPGHGPQGLGTQGQGGPGQGTQGSHGQPGSGQGAPGHGPQGLGTQGQGVPGQGGPNQGQGAHGTSGQGVHGQRTSGQGGQGPGTPEQGVQGVQGQGAQRGSGQGVQGQGGQGSSGQGVQSQATQGQSVQGQRTSGQSTEQGRQSFGGQTVSEGTQDQSTQGQFAQGQFAQGQFPQGQFAQGQFPQGQFPQGQFPQGQFPQGQFPQGQFPQGQFPQGQFPQGQFPQGQLPQGQFAPGQFPQGQFPQGQFPPGQFPPGQFPPGQFAQGIPRQGQPGSGQPWGGQTGQGQGPPRQGVPGQGQGPPGQWGPPGQQWGGQGGPRQANAGQQWGGQGPAGQRMPGQTWRGQGPPGQSGPGQSWGGPGAPGQGNTGQQWTGQGPAGQRMPGQKGGQGQGPPGQWGGQGGQGPPGQWGGQGGQGPSGQWDGQGNQGQWDGQGNQGQWGQQGSQGQAPGQPWEGQTIPDQGNAEQSATGAGTEGVPAQDGGVSEQVTNETGTETAKDGSAEKAAAEGVSGQDGNTAEKSATEEVSATDGTTAEQSTADMDGTEKKEEEATKQGYPGGGYPDQGNTEGYSEHSTTKSGLKKKRKGPKRNRKKAAHDPAVTQEDLAAQEFIEVPKPKLGEHIEVLTMESYLASLGRDDLENMAAGAVQQELQRQYAAMQGMQNQLAKDIQEKMEIIYQKLLREIITQQLTSSPYTVVEGEEKCLGPGICKGHGMPAGIAVCQYPDPNEPSMSVKPTVGDAECPSCEKDEALKNLRRPHRELMGKASVMTKGYKSETGPVGGSELSNMELKEVKDAATYVSFDLEKLRSDLKLIDFGEFDEKDILERVGTLWEAVKVLRSNEDALSKKIAHNEHLLKNGGLKNEQTKSKLGLIGDHAHENASAVPVVHKTSMKEHVSGSAAPMEEKGDDKAGDGPDKDDIQTLFNNLSNVIAECADQKERIDQLVDAVRIIESGMVTKQFLMDMISDKADKGQINTKVSYDEFGNTVDELHTQIHNLMVEGYQRNENWKKVTADLAEELAEKLDKVELAPIRAFFKSRLKKIEDRVQALSAILEEPDSAGTRKKLLKDYNCISCDRRVNISGMTNSSLLPVLGPSVAMPASASHRTFDLHRLRNQRTRFDADAREIIALEKQVINQARAKAGLRNDRPLPLSGKNMMNLVNRYCGGVNPSMMSQEQPTNVAAPASKSSQQMLRQPSGPKVEQPPPQSVSQRISSVAVHVNSSIYEEEELFEASETMLAPPEEEEEEELIMEIMEE